MATARRLGAGPRIVLKGMLLVIVLLTVGSLPFLGIGAIVVPIILVPAWIACVMFLAHRTGRWSPNHGWTPSSHAHSRSPEALEEPRRPRPSST